MSALLDLNIIWFILVGVLLTGYAILDGFDLGVGALHLFTKSDHERRIMINSIGPVWDGNEVWLVTGGGALFAAFPEVYATAFSAFYLAFMLLLGALIFRAVAIEFRSKQPMAWWRTLWDISFSISSILASFLIGVALGNIIWGISLDSDYEFSGKFLDLLHPYALLVGVTVVALFMMHGALYALVKTEGLLHDRIKGWVRNTIIFFGVCYIFTTVMTLVYVPHMTDTLWANPIFWGIILVTLLALANILRELRQGKHLRAFLSSCLSITGMMTLFGWGMFPNLLYSKPFTQYSLTIYNGSSSPKTLQIMLIIALIGMPLVISYTAAIYWVFRGKVKLDSMSY